MLQIVLNIIVLSIVYALIAISFRVTQGVLRFFNIAHAIVLTLGGYLVYEMTIQCAWPLSLAVLASILITVLLMLLIDHFLYRPLRLRNAANWQLMLVSLGLYVLLQNIVSLIWGDSTLSFRFWEIKEGHMFYGLYINDLEIVTVCSGFLLLCLFWLFIEKTNVGMKIKAVSSNYELSSILAISEENAVKWSVGIGTALATCAGILIAADTDLSPTLGFNWLLYAIVVIIISGMGKIRHILLGALLLATFQHLVAYYLDSKWMNSVAYIILIIFLFFCPSGISRKRIKKVDL